MVICNVDTKQKHDACVSNVSFTLDNLDARLKVFLRHLDVLAVKIICDYNLCVGKNKPYRRSLKGRLLQQYITYLLWIIHRTHCQQS